jgi:hypothetical protein
MGLCLLPRGFSREIRKREHPDQGTLIVEDEEATDLGVAHSPLGLCHGVLGSAREDLPGHCVADTQLLQRFPLKEGVHTDVTIGDHTNRPVAAIDGGANREASAIVIPHELGCVLQGVFGSA